MEALPGDVEPPFVRRWRDEALGVELLYCGGVPPGVPEHHHPTWQLGAVLEGAVRVTTLGAVVELRPGETLALPPLTPHAVSPAGNLRARYLQVEAQGPLMPGPAHAALGPAAAPRLWALAQASWTQAVLSDRSPLWGALWSEVEQTFSIPSGPLRAPSAPERRVLDYLDAVTDRPVPLEELVDLSDLPRATLMRRFRRSFGTTPSRYHLHRRIYQAVERIDGGESLAEAALGQGFYDQSHFARHASPVLAMSPARWRTRRRVP